MTPNVRQQVQEEILDSIKRAHPGVRDIDIAETAGVERSEGSRWRDGTRRLSIDALDALAVAYGAHAVYGGLAARGGATVQAEVRASGGSLVARVCDLAGRMGDVARAVTESTSATSPGGSAITADERRQLADTTSALVREAVGLESCVRGLPLRVAR